MRDFSIQKYKNLLRTIKQNGFTTLTILEFLNAKPDSEVKIAILRHDIDTKYDLPLALKMARFEIENDIKASYYFRTVPDTLDLEVIKEIANMGHEIGYHYEVMSFASGDEKKAILLFEKDLKILRNIYPVKTICQHGGAMGLYNTTSIRGLFKIGFDYIRGEIKNIEYFPSIILWEKYKYETFGLVGDAYLSIDFEKIKYFSDTGQRWDSFGSRILDKIEEGENSSIAARSTNDLIKIIESGVVPQINLLVHPANWHENILAWLNWKILQHVRNVLKKIYNPKVHK